jgi:hypothetical protein
VIVHLIFVCLFIATVAFFSIIIPAIPAPDAVRSSRSLARPARDGRWQLRSDVLAPLAARLAAPARSAIACSLLARMGASLPLGACARRNKSRWPCAMGNAIGV